MRHLRFSCLFLFFSLSIGLLNAQKLDWVSNVGARKSPFSKNQYWVNDYGAVNDGSKITTTAIQQAIDACAAKGGGKVSLRTWMAMAEQSKRTFIQLANNSKSYEIYRWPDRPIFTFVYHTKERETCLLYYWRFHCS